MASNPYLLQDEELENAIHNKQLWGRSIATTSTQSMWPGIKNWYDPSIKPADDRITISKDLFQKVDVLYKLLFENEV